MIATIHRRVTGFLENHEAGHGIDATVRVDGTHLFRRSKLAQHLKRAAVKLAARLGGNRRCDEVRDERMNDAHPATIELYEGVSGKLVEAVQLVVLRDAAQGIQVARPAENGSGLKEALGVDLEPFDAPGDGVRQARSRPVLRGHTKRLELLQMQRQHLTADRLGDLVEPGHQAKMERASQELLGLPRVETFEMNHFIGEDASIVIAGGHQKHGLCPERTRELHDSSLGQPIAIRKVIKDQHDSPTRCPPARAPHRRGQCFGHRACPRTAVAAEQARRVHHFTNPGAGERGAEVVSPERHPRQLRIVDFQELR